MPMYLWIEKRKDVDFKHILSKEHQNLKSNIFRDFLKSKFDIQHSHANLFENKNENKEK